MKLNKLVSYISLSHAETNEGNEIGETKAA